MDEPLGRTLKRTEVSANICGTIIFIDTRNKQIVKESFEVPLCRKPSELWDDFSGYYTITMSSDNYTERYSQIYFCGCLVSWVMEWTGWLAGRLEEIEMWICTCNFHWSVFNYKPLFPEWNVDLISGMLSSCSDCWWIHLGEIIISIRRCIDYFWVTTWCTCTGTRCWQSWCFPLIETQLHAFYFPPSQYELVGLTF